jgi:ParB-like chromosome segregation protein Spo0J
MLFRPVVNLRVHPDADLVPEMLPLEYHDLLIDIRARGIVTPLDVLKGVVLDGRHRLRAAHELRLDSVPVRDVVLDGQSAQDWMLKAAVLRRHLTDDQRAMIAAMYAKAHPRPKTGRPIKSSPPRKGATSHHSPARTAAAQQMNVSPKRAEKAAAVLKANPELAGKVHSGQVAMAKALRQVRLDRAVATVRTELSPDAFEYEVNRLKHIGDVRRLQEQYPERFAADEILDLLEHAVHEALPWVDRLTVEYPGRYSHEQWRVLLDELERVRDGITSWYNALTKEKGQ